MIDYIYTILEKYVTLTNVMWFLSIALPLLVIWVFWGENEPRNTIMSWLGDLNRKHKK